jgi:hypothetical protein
VSVNDKRGLAATPPYIKEPWVDCRFGQPGSWHRDSADSSHEKVTHSPRGMTTNDLVEAQEKFTEYARSRIAGAGNREYSRGSMQAFEDMSVVQLVHELRDEIADALNYLAFMDIQLSRWQQAVERVER